MKSILIVEDNEAIIKGLKYLLEIEKNNGYVKVDSEVGKGTTFEIKYLK